MPTRFRDHPALLLSRRSTRVLGHDRRSLAHPCAVISSRHWGAVTGPSWGRLEALSAGKEEEAWRKWWGLWAWEQVDGLRGPICSPSHCPIPTGRLQYVSDSSCCENYALRLPPPQTRGGGSQCKWVQVLIGVFQPYSKTSATKKTTNELHFFSTAVFSQGKLYEVSSQPVVLVDDTIQKISDVD